mmetsp:Transcript_8169/g.18256  ORF Transcript_8169/g.18256 Transcript_8169/m.18256 type:complete len:540 (+) Transcript_8169:94-1713(+)
MLLLLAWPLVVGLVCTTLAVAADMFSHQDANETGGHGKYYWSKRGTATSNSFTTVEAPQGPSYLSWIWYNELDEEVRFSPLIDGDRNIYLQTGMRVRKFSVDGYLLWTWNVDPSTDGKMNIAGVLHEGMMVVLTNWQHCWNATLQYHGAVIALSMETGMQIFRQNIMHCLGMDCSSLFIEKDVLIYGAMEPVRARHGFGEDGTNLVVAMNLTSLEEIWTYATDDIMWNFMPSSVGDGTIVFSSTCGGVYRIGLHHGDQVWHRGRKGAPGVARWCGAAGGVMGPDGYFYAEYNDHHSDRSLTSLGKLAKFRLSDGERLWERAVGLHSGLPPELMTRRHQVELGAWQYPSIGPINGRMTVVATFGGINALPPYPGHWKTPDIFKLAAYMAYLTSPWVRRVFFDAPVLMNEVLAVDAETGTVLWRYVMPSWDHFASVSDESEMGRRYHQMMMAGSSDVHSDLLCVPDNQGIPVITGDGSVYATDSHFGALFVIKDRNKDGIIADDEVFKFETNKEFLNSPSFAPGMVVAAPCWGNTYVFREY